MRPGLALSGMSGAALGGQLKSVPTVCGAGAVTVRTVDAGASGTPGGLDPSCPRPPGRVREAWTVPRCPAGAFADALVEVA